MSQDAAQRYQPFMVPDQDVGPNDETPHQLAAWQQSIESIQRDQGNHIAICAVANMYNLCIVVYQAGFEEGHTKILPENGSPDRCVHLFRLLGVTSHRANDNHYQIVENVSEGDDATSRPSADSQSDDEASDSTTAAASSNDVGAAASSQAVEDSDMSAASSNDMGAAASSQAVEARQTKQTLMTDYVC